MNRKGIWPVGGLLLIAIVGGFVVCAMKSSEHSKEVAEISGGVE